jgi:hypothetical protein
VDQIVLFMVVGTCRCVAKDREGRRAYLFKGKNRNIIKLTCIDLI